MPSSHSISGCWRGMGVVILAGAFLAGCQTGPPREPVPGEPVRVGHLIPLSPISVTSTLHFAEGGYPNLFSGDSLAIWMSGSAPAALPGQAAAQQQALDTLAPVPAPPDMDLPMMQEHFAVFELRLHSAFADASIAYDAVGLSGINVYLLAPTGERIAPAQVIMGRDLVERQQGALKVFSRTNRVTFPREHVKLVVPGNLRAPALRLVLEGYGNTFYFEWHGQLPAEVAPPPLGQSEEAQRTREGLRRARERTRGWGRTFS
jgi:hypothetical protein